MAYSKKTWKGRLGTGLNKYVIGTIDTNGKQTITSSPDTITQEGDALSATNLNDLESRIESEFNNIANGNTVVSKATKDASGNVITTTYATKPSSFTQGNLPKLDSNGNLNDAGVPANNVAQQDGYYQNLGAGTAEQLISNIYEEDSTPYNFRTSGGSVDIGDREVDEIVGGTVAWNQLSDALATHTVNDVVVTKNEDGTITINGIANSSGSLSTHTIVPTIKEHIYLVIASDSMCNLGFDSLYTNINGNETHNNSFIIKAQSAVNATISFRTNNAYTFSNVKASLCTFDLTLMFGKTIADYIYTLESANAGTGVAFFRKLFPKDYYAYNAGELISVKTSSHDMVKFNAYDHSAGTAKVVGEQVYQITGAYTALTFNEETITPDSNGYFTPSINGVVIVTGGNSTTTCIHLKWDGERDGEYEAYEKNSYALDSDLELRGIPKLDANNKFYYDGDVYENNGTVTRKYGSYTFTGNETWSTTGSGTSQFFFTTISDAKSTPNQNIKCNKYVTGTVSSTNTDDKTIEANGTQIRVRDYAYTTTSALKTAMTGVKIVYELDTSTTESADPYTNPQIVDDWGTEEYVDTRDVAIPVGHNTKYQPNLRAKLEMAPDSPDGNGDYLMRQTDGENAYVKYTDGGRISNIEERLGLLDFSETETSDMPQINVIAKDLDDAEEVLESVTEKMGTLDFSEDDDISINVSSAPESASATGIKGQYYIDTDYLYICVGTNTWKRVALSTF